MASELRGPHGRTQEVTSTRREGNGVSPSWFLSLFPLIRIQLSAYGRGSTSCSWWLTSWMYGLELFFLQLQLSDGVDVEVCSSDRFAVEGDGDGVRRTLSLAWLHDVQELYRIVAPQASSFHLFREGTSGGHVQVCL